MYDGEHNIDKLEVLLHADLISYLDGFMKQCKCKQWQVVGSQG